MKLADQSIGMFDAEPRDNRQDDAPEHPVQDPMATHRQMRLATPPVEPSWATPAELIDRHLERSRDEWLLPFQLPQGSDGAQVLSTGDDLLKLFSLRQDLFQQDGARGYHSISSDPEYFIESCDLPALQTAYLKSGRIQFGLRLQTAADIASNPNYSDAWNCLRNVLSANDVLMTRFVSSDTSNGLRGIWELFKLNYATALANDVKVSYLTCAPQHTVFFSRIGYRPFAEYECRHAGAQHVLRLDLEDGDHLASVRSPLVPVWSEFFAP